MFSDIKAHVLCMRKIDPTTLRISLMEDVLCFPYILFQSWIGIKGTYTFIDCSFSQLQNWSPKYQFYICILWHAIACTKTVDTMQKFRKDSQTYYLHNNWILAGNYCTWRIQVCTSYFFDINFITILSPKVSVSKCFFPSGYPTKTMYASLFSSVLHT